MVGVDTPSWRVKHERSVLKGEPRDTTEWSGHHRGSADGSMKEEAIFSELEKYEEYVRLGRWIIGIVVIHGSANSQESVRRPHKGLKKTYRV